MKVWWQEAKPHRDVLSGELTEDRFAANLWKVRLGEAPKDYQDAELFFRRTHLTQGMKALIKEVMERLIHSKGNSVITLQTPFGGGKHTPSSPSGISSKILLKFAILRAFEGCWRKCASESYRM